MTEQYIKKLVERSRAAQKVAALYSQRRVDELSAAIVWAFSRPGLAREIAALALEETGMGSLESKISKMMGKLPAVFYDIKDVKTVGIVDRDDKMGITKIAKPLGVIAALIPSTNPEGTPLFKGVLGLRGRNSVIFAPHPKSRRTTARIVDIMRAILEQNGAPADLFICVENPSKEVSAALMSACDITMATGSADMVRAAYSSGKPAYGVGAGNAPVVVDGTTDLYETANKIMVGKTGDHASGCSAENSLIINSAVYDEMVERLKEVGGYLADGEEKERLLRAMWKEGHLSRDIVAKPVSVIAAAAGIKIPDTTRFIMVEETGIGPDYPFSGEKLSLVLTLYRYDTFDEAIDKVNAITRFSGFGHSCGIHSKDDEHIERLALNTFTTKVIVCQPHGSSNAGNWHNGLANTFSLGCGTWGGNIVSENITQKHYINLTWVSRPIDRKAKGDDEIFGDLLENIKLWEEER